ncbi:MAG: hypothetical protein FWD69_19530 [Polyangiaceae bacterium]|nr:hypothetical protein [Polyangiaceae bacterium]
MEGFSEFEHAVLAKLLAGDHAVLGVLRAQAQMARLASREYTGAGFFLSFDVPPEAPALATKNFHFGDVTAAIDGLRYGAGFVVFVRNGRLDTLEGYSYEEPWPKEIRSFKLSYQHEPRGLSLPDPLTSAT